MCQPFFSTLHHFYMQGLFFAGPVRTQQKKINKILLQKNIYCNKRAAFTSLEAWTRSPWTTALSDSITFLHISGEFLNISHTNSATSPSLHPLDSNVKIWWLQIPITPNSRITSLVFLRFGHLVKVVTWPLKSWTGFFFHSTDRLFTPTFPSVWVAEKALNEFFLELCFHIP